MANSKLQFLPLLLFIMFPVSFIITYTIAVSKGHIKAFYSYISDTGTTAPEQCWFAIFLNLTAVVLGAVVYIRFKQVEEYFRTRNTNVKCMNTFGLVLGIVSALGVMVVGCFQEANILVMHVVGANMAFLGGGFYMTCQAYFTFKMLPMFTNKFVAILRMFIGIACIILFIITFSLAIVSMNQFTGEKTLLWEPHHGGWTTHVISVVAEWVMAALFDIYVITFMMDFRKVTFEGPKFRIVETKGSDGNANTKKFVQVQYRVGADETNA
jgi:uncharacterized membrane protein YidH (DUF202 family)